MELERIARFPAQGPGMRPKEGVENSYAFILLSLSFLLNFYRLAFTLEAGPPLLLIVAEGEFIKKEGQTRFTGGYNDLARLNNDIQILDGKISPEGICGERYAKVLQEASSPQVKRRKIQLLTEDADEKSYQIIERTRAAVGSLLDAVAGILKKDA